MILSVFNLCTVQKSARKAFARPPKFSLCAKNTAFQASSAEISICERELFFSAKPYFLRLYLPRSIVEDGKETTTYECDTGTFVITVSKKCPGESFPGLDMITKLLTPNGRSKADPLIQEEYDEENDEVYFEQNLDFASSLAPSSSKSFGYGFANKKIKIFSQLREEFAYLVEVSDPDNTPNGERQSISFKNEQEKFNEEHYLADTFSCDEIQALLDFKSWWNTANKEQLYFNSQEKDRLKDLPKRTFGKFDKSTMESALYSLVDILFAYAYDIRITDGESNSESGWLISKLSPTLSCFLSHFNLESCIKSSYRRCLTFPLYRAWSLVSKTYDDVIQICRLGSRAVLKCFLAMHATMIDSGDYYYIFNDLYITDYCLWIQYLEDGIFLRMADQISKVKIEKSEVGLDLLELELAAKLCVEETNDHPHSFQSEINVLEYIRDHIGHLSNQHQSLDSDDDQIDDTTIDDLTMKAKELCIQRK